MEQNKTNMEVARDMAQYGANVENVCWLALQVGSDKAKETIEDFYADVSFKDMHAMLPSIPLESLRAVDSNDDFHQLLLDYRVWGWLACIHVPDTDNFRFREGKPVSWSVHGGSCRVEWVYAEDLDLLQTAIKERSAEVFQESVAKALASTPPQE